MRLIEFPQQSEWVDLCKRPSMDSSQLEATITSVFQEVENRGDIALKSFTSQFDAVHLDNIQLEKDKLAELAESVPERLKQAIQIAHHNIKQFHESQQLIINKIETTPGVLCWQEARPIESVGLYIPGGTAPLFSTVLMLAIPASIAGCSEIILCTPPDKNGEINPAIAYAAKISGITKICTVGGAQAIAAMSLGTESVTKAYKIFGPGNQYVTAAKQYAQRIGTAIDMPAGPSELLVIASDNANAQYVASDLLSQAEHGIDSQVICLSSSETMLKAISEEVALQLEELPRKDIAAIAIEHSRLILLKDESEIIAFSNTYGPEHLIIADEEYDSYISQISNAGSVFLGNYCPESAGDYASGTNHTLPTAGYAKAYNGVNLDSFCKKITFQEISAEGIRNLGETIEILAEAEGLQAHKNAVTLRLNDLNQKDERN